MDKHTLLIFEPLSIPQIPIVLRVYQNEVSAASVNDSIRSRQSSSIRRVSKHLLIIPTISMTSAHPVLHILRLGLH